MHLLLILPGYFLWHYTTAWRDLWHLWRNALWFINHFFSIPILLRTLFSPWKRMVEERQRKFDLEDWASRVLVNLISRLVGAAVRIIVIVLGLVTMFATLFIGVCLFLFWLVAPAAIFGLFFTGIYFLF